MKDVPNFYQANPEFKGKTNKASNEIGKMADKQKAEQGKVKVKSAEEDEEQKVQLERVQKMMLEGGEINVLDAKQVDIDSPEMSKFERVVKFGVLNDENNICHYLSEHDDR